MPYELLDEEPQDLSFGEMASEAGRHAARTGSDIITQAIGAPGDIFSLINDYAIAPSLEKITGDKAAPYEKTLLGKLLPTTETHRKGVENQFGEYLKPQNDVENFGREVTDIATSITSPAKLVKQGIKTGGYLLKNIGKALATTTAGEAVKGYADSDEAGTWTKVGALFTLSLLDRDSAAKQVGQAIGKAESLIPQGASTSAAPLARKLNRLELDITKGRPISSVSSEEQYVLKHIDKVKDLIDPSGTIDVKQAIAQKRSLYKDLKELYKEVSSFEGQKTVKSRAKQVARYLNETIDEYGKTNPKFYKEFKEAEKGFETLAKSHFISNWVKDNIAQNKFVHNLTSLFENPLADLGSLSLGKNAIAAAAGYKSIQTMYKVAKSPLLAKIYAKALTAAANEDKVAFNKYLKELDEGLEEEEKTHKYEFLD